MPEAAGGHSGTDAVVDSSVSNGAGGSGGAAGTSTGSGGSADAGLGDVCPAWPKSCNSALPARVLQFVVEASSTMSDSVPSNRYETKWDRTRKLLIEQFGCLDSVSALGVTYFSSDGELTIPIAPNTEKQQATLTNSIAAVKPSGLAPSLVAWRAALKRITSWKAPTPELDGLRSIVLVVDGVPTVNEDGVTVGGGPYGTITEQEYERFIQAVAVEGTQQAGITTWVFGIPGSEDPRGADYDPLVQLSRLAVAGGTCTAHCTLPTEGVISSCYDAVRERRSTCLVSRGSYCHQDLNTVYDFTVAPGFSWVVRGTLAGMAQPGTGAAVDAALSYLAWKGITRLVSLTTEPVDSSTAQAHGISVLHLPIPDFTAPTQPQIVKFVTDVRATIDNGGSVAVQCGAGLGRTGTMLACYFVSDGMTADQAINHVRELRPGSIETQAQVQAIQDYAASLGR